MFWFYLKQGIGQMGNLASFISGVQDFQKIELPKTLKQAIPFLMGEMIPFVIIPAAIAVLVVLF